MSEISNEDVNVSEIGNNEISETIENNDILETDSEISESSMLESYELDKELNDTYGKYLNDMSGYENIDNFERKPANKKSSVF